MNIKKPAKTREEVLQSVEDLCKKMKKARMRMEAAHYDLDTEQGIGLLSRLLKEPRSTRAKIIYH